MGGKHKIYELIIEIGQISSPLKNKPPNGYTHKWTVYVRGTNESKIEHCIQRVLFRLHESFPNPRRELYEPPYEVKETGYAGFEIPIEVHFKSKDKANTVQFVHDLYLLTDSRHNTNKVEKLKFVNPNRDFERLLIKAGAHLIQTKVEKKERSHSPPTKKQKSSSLIPSKDMNKVVAPGSSSRDPASTSSRDFADVFGTPLIYNKHQPALERTSAGTTSTNTPATTATTTSISTTATTIPFSTSTSSTSKPQIDLQTIRARISNLQDCNQLQRIVDIIEESGEWFNVTHKKFEFDLKRIDSKTLHKIERCLR